MIILPKLIYRFNEIPIKIAMIFFTEIGKKNPEICMETQKTMSSQIMQSKKSNAGSIIIPDLKLYYGVKLTKQHDIGIKNRHTDQQDGIEDPEETMVCQWTPL
jgi:hypothetical protein